jgi:hypothetical protein
VASGSSAARDGAIGGSVTTYQKVMMGIAIYIAVIATVILGKL